MITLILQARTTSTRLPGKVLKPLMNKPMIAFEWERLKRCRRVDQWVVATSRDASDDALEKVCQSHQMNCFRGSLEDVLDRFYQAATAMKATHVVRITADCPLIDPEIVDRVIQTHLDQSSDYTSNIHPPTFPDGLDAEVVRYACLKDAWEKARLSSEREHVTPYFYQTPGRFKTENVRHSSDLSAWRWTVDEPSDYAFASTIVEALYPTQPNFTMNTVLDYLDKHPEIDRRNQTIVRNEGYERSLRKDTSHE